jgi:alginate O-acetyltransferase complex protein AlgI
MPIFDAFLIILTAVTLVAYHLLPVPRWRVWLLCLSSALYIAYLDLGALVVAVVLAAFAYLGAMGVQRLAKGPARKTAMAAGIAGLLAGLVYYKYRGFFLGAIGIAPQDAPVHTLWVPLGISFLTFRLIAYFVDQQLPKAERPAVDSFALFVLFFPTFIAGPIERWTTFHRGPSLTVDRSAAGWALERILYGVAKKVIIADRLTQFLLKASAGPLDPSRRDSWIMFFGYAAQIYFDFSAYSDIAIGLGRLFGYDIMENFNRPYLARNMADFWRRWHISLSEWIRVYLFMPIATRRPSTARLHVATLVSMALCGLWHGAGWNFVLWGVYHGVGISAFHLWAAARRKFPAAEAIGKWRIAGPLSIGATYLYVTFSFVFFSKPLEYTAVILRQMMGGH